MAEKKSAKVGRNANKNQAKAYKAGRRWEVNAKKRSERHHKRFGSKFLKVPRGTARAKRRSAVNWSAYHAALEAGMDVHWSKPIPLVEQKA